MRRGARQKRSRTLALDSTVGASQGETSSPFSFVRSSARGCSGPSQRNQPVGGWRWYMWLAAPKKPSRPSSRS